MEQENPEIDIPGALGMLKEVGDCEHAMVDNEARLRALREMDCSVCLAPFEFGQIITATPCQHVKRV